MNVWSEGGIPGAADSPGVGSSTLVASGVREAAEQGCGWGREAAAGEDWGQDEPACGVRGGM